MPRQTPTLTSEQTDLHVLVALSVHDSNRVLHRILRIGPFAENRAERRHGICRVWAARVAIAMAVIAVIALYTVTVVQLQMPVSADPFE